MSGLLTKEPSGAHSAKHDAAIMRTIIATILAIFTAVFLQGLLPQSPGNIQDFYSTEPSGEGAVSVLAEDNHNTVEVAEPAPEPEPEPEPVPEPAPQPVVWAVTKSPHGRVPVDKINTALAHLQKKGLSKEGAAYLVGNFIGESYLTPCGQYGDGGKAHGFAQWHPTRRHDMPCGFIEQLDWAIDVEMVRDSRGNYPCACEALKTADIPTIKLRLKQWERWGVEGNRWAYAASVYSQL